MRINIYSQELTSKVSIVSKAGTDDVGQPATFHGVRMMLDDDRSAITLWLPKSSHRRQELANALYEMAQLVDSHV